MTTISRARRTLGAALVAGAVPGIALAQTDYYNTDAGRPVRIEDAYAIERRGVELQAAPLRLERAKGGVYRWGLEPEIALGVLPRTQLEVGAPLVYVDGGLGTHTTSLAGIDVSVLHNLNVETRLPALGIRGDLLLPAGALGPDRVYSSLTGIATKTFRWARVHANGQYTFGRAATAAAAGARAVEVSRWLAGAAIDRTFPLRSMLVTGEVYARRPLHDGADVEWHAGVGTRYQLTPRWAIDGGVGRRLTGDDPAWSLTAGGAWAFGLPWSAR
ncbi:hypothetical protein J421_5103 (plasmid) [Gemmatirosa kalamazoonensis]|uniref:MetA-pathway of phenol degradation n=1 Tax=Gemmatirosa kalamazoonensis TaxID=861299 RepID=W0RST0_9BACT|nr:hypothetical protein [Gemmatirosa kalamazoonensis]AHG92638.1 hypothetical protein J421_5103 [Gemmatirosa kalamazoonensis]